MDRCSMIWDIDTCQQLYEALSHNCSSKMPICRSRNWYEWLGNVLQHMLPNAGFDGWRVACSSCTLLSIYLLRLTMLATGKQHLSFPGEADIMESWLSSSDRHPMRRCDSSPLALQCAPFPCTHTTQLCDYGGLQTHPNRKYEQGNKKCPIVFHVY